MHMLACVPQVEHHIFRTAAVQPASGYASFLAVDIDAGGWAPGAFRPVNHSQQLNLPLERAQLPDVFIYLVNAKGTRVAFHRAPGNELVAHAGCFVPSVVILRPTKPYDPTVPLPSVVLSLTLELQAGMAAAAAAAPSMPWPPPPNVLPLHVPRRAYEVRLHVYQARDLPARDDSGSLDPFVTASLCGIELRAQDGKTRTAVQTQTAFPLYYQTLRAMVWLPPLGLAPDMVVTVMDHDTTSENDFVGTVRLALRHTLGRLGAQDEATELAREQGARAVPPAAVPDGGVDLDEISSITVDASERGPTAIPAEGSQRLQAAAALPMPQWFDLCAYDVRGGGGSVLLRAELIEAPGGGSEPEAGSGGRGRSRATSSAASASASSAVDPAASAPEVATPSSVGQPAPAPPGDLLVPWEALPDLRPATQRCSLQIAVLGLRGVRLPRRLTALRTGIGSVPSQPFVQFEVGAKGSWQSCRTPASNKPVRNGKRFNPFSFSPSLSPESMCASPPSAMLVTRTRHVETCSDRDL